MPEGVIEHGSVMLNPPDGVTHLEFANRVQLAVSLDSVG
jgi:hypothetical protein